MDLFIFLQVQEADFPHAVVLKFVLEFWIYSVLFGIIKYEKGETSASISHIARYWICRSRNMEGQRRQ